ncbi:hypothetical protein PNK_2112 [Candidatus Protochlamydia naegleriophila]|uniref:Uncharacterized protein n=1 Tax=Candidatus Protochlamydia naegleriophila TaxID=389348 RepID=A0A0U5ETX4_9BACT|nr:hypothetical protein [Candidatus Protochlamydia naegleriophila]CUI17715.1 hypothetical protein PNK_2112 [Candidatus Protochlamydia naegleriophila]
MTVLTLNEMPFALSYTLDRYVFGADFLNPVNSGQGVISTFIGKPVRAVARLVNEASMAIFVGFIGTNYHAAKGIIYKVKALINGDPALKNKYSKLGLEHFKAAWTDFSALATTNTAIIGNPSLVLPRYAPKAKVKIEEVRRDNAEWIGYLFPNTSSEEIDELIARQQTFDVKKLALAATSIREIETAYKRMHNDSSHTPLRPLNDRGVLLISLRGDGLVQTVFGLNPAKIIENLNSTQF